MAAVPSMLCDRGAVGAPMLDITAMFNHSFANGPTGFADVDLVTSPTWNLVDNAVAPVRNNGVLRSDELAANGGVGLEYDAYATLL